MRGMAAGRAAGRAARRAAASRGAAASRVAATAALAIAAAAVMAAHVGCGPRGDRRAPGPPGPPNVVFIVGDGFGVGAWSLAREAVRAHGDSLAMDTAADVGFLDTRAADEIVTDSASAATSWSTGALVPRFAVGLADSGRRLPILFEDLRALGRPFGFVTTTRVTHATLAPFYARVGHRDEEDSIAVQLVAAAPDVAIGGGLEHFLPEGAAGSKNDAGRADGRDGGRADGRDLLAEAEKAGIAVMRTWVEPLPAGKPVLALLAPSHLPHEPDRRGEPDLADLAVAAIRRLESAKKPWFLLVEEGQIDRAAHDHDAASVAANTRRLDRALAAILRTVDRSRTLVVLASDHGTASPAILEGAHPESLDVATASVEAMTARLFADGAWVGTPRGFETFAVPILDEGTRHTGLTAGNLDAILTMTNRYDRQAALGTVLSRRFGVVFLPLEDRIASTGVHGHTAEPVPVRAWGPRAGEIRGVRDHAALGRWLRDVMGVTRPGAPALEGQRARPGPAAVPRTGS